MKPNQKLKHCKQCGKLLGPERSRYKIPTCRTCLPPPPVINLFERRFSETK